MQIIDKRTIDLIPYVNNAKTHSAEQIDLIAGSIQEFGFNNPILVDSDNGIIAGHARLQAASKLGLDSVPTIELKHLTEAQKKAYILADNRLGEVYTDWDMELVNNELDFIIDTAEFDAALTGFDLPDDEPEQGLTDDDEVPELKQTQITKLGDVWLLGEHRLMCGDSTNAKNIDKLMRGQKADLMHADPPYGMGKEKDGVANDNLYGENLDKFQMSWWAAVRPYLQDNSSGYIWGNATELFSLWFRSGFSQSEKINFKNEIVWKKNTCIGKRSHLFTMYPTSTERCLFFALGNQFMGNINSYDFPEEYQPLLDYLTNEAKNAGVNSRTIQDLLGVGMWSHWFTKSQFSLIPEKHYLKLKDKFSGHFLKPWKELKTHYSHARNDVTGEFRKRRSYFDNTHEKMTDVWEYDIVVNEERHDHATPKPVEMMERVMKSSLPVGGLCVEPFGGSGSTLMGAEKTQRVCYTMELNPSYCDVIIKRWQNFTGKSASLESTGQTFDEMNALN